MLSPVSTGMGDHMHDTVLTVLFEVFLDISVQSQLKQFCLDLVSWILKSTVSAQSKILQTLVSKICFFYIMYFGYHWMMKVVMNVW